MSASTEPQHRGPSPPASTSSAPSTTAQSPHEQYTVIVRGVSFHLSRSQVEFDSPNYFTAAFLEHDFAEAQSRTLHLDRNPQLFTVIVEYLSGYHVTPLQVKPDTMSMDQASKNLKVDAEYFGLDRLEALLRGPPPTCNKVVGYSCHTNVCYAYAQFCSIEAHKERGDVAQLLWAAGFTTASTFYQYRHVLNYDYLVERVGLSPTSARLIADRQGDREWALWDEVLAQDKARK